MKLLFISPYPPVRDGIGDYTAALVEALAGRGHEVRVLAARAAPATARPEVIAQLPTGLRAIDDAVGAVRDFDPDVIHVQFAVAAFGARVPSLWRLLRTIRPGSARVVITFHEVTRDTDTLRAAGRALYRGLACLADVNVVHHDRAARALADLGAAQPPGVVVPHPRAELPEPTATAAQLDARLGLQGRRVLLAFGFIHVDKGLGDLVDALARLAAMDGRYADVTLVVAGTVRPRNSLFKPFEWRDRHHLRKVGRAIRRHGLEDCVRFTGYVEAGEIEAFFQLAEVAVLPYRRIEDSGVANLAMAAGAPMIVTDAGVLPAYVPDPSRRTPAADPRALAEAIAGFLDAPAPAAHAAGADESLRGAEFSTVVDETAEVYRRVTQRRA